MPAFSIGNSQVGGPATPGVQFAAQQMQSFPTAAWASFAPQDVEFPDWLTAPPPALNNSNAPLQAFQGQLAGFRQAVNPMLKSFDQLSGYTESLGRQAATAAQRSYANRAAQTGGSTLGAGFAGAQAMLPVYRQMANIAGMRGQALYDSRLRETQFQQALAGMLSDDVARDNALRAQMEAQQRTLMSNYAAQMMDAHLRSFLAQQQMGARGGSIGAKYGGGGGGAGGGFGTPFNPGYITNSGPIMGGTPITNFRNGTTGFLGAYGPQAHMGFPQSWGNFSAPTTNEGASFGPSGMLFTKSYAQRQQEAEDKQKKAASEAAKSGGTFGIPFGGMLT